MTISTPSPAKSLTSGRSERENLVLNYISANATPTPRATRRTREKAKVTWSEEDRAARHSWEARNGDQSFSGFFLGAGANLLLGFLRGARAHVSTERSHALPAPGTCGSGTGSLDRGVEAKEEKTKENRTRRSGSCGRGLWRDVG